MLATGVVGRPSGCGRQSVAAPSDSVGTGTAGEDLKELSGGQKACAAAAPWRMKIDGGRAGV